MSGTLSRRLARYVQATAFDQLGAETVEAARRSLVDAVAVTLATGRYGAECLPFVALARESGSGPCTVIGRGFRTAPVMAAFANGAMAHVLDFEDTNDATMMHPNAAVIPAALAIAESQGGVSGQDLLAAIALGADLCVRIARGVVTDPTQGHWYLLPMINAYGAAAAAGRLLQLDEQQLVAAFSLAACQATYSAELKRSPDSHLRGIRDAYAASAGVTAALLARKGARGYDLPFEGEAGFFAMHGQAGWQESAVLDGLGTRFAGAEVSYKPWPSCRGTHAHIDAALQLREAHGLRAADVERLHAVIGPMWKMLCLPAPQKREPKTEVDGKFSLPFTLGLALSRGRVALEDFGCDALNDPEVLGLAARFTWEMNPAWTFQDATAGTLVITTRDGRQLTQHVDTPLGDPTRPLTAAQSRDKFRACAAHAAVPFQADEVEAFLARCDRLEAIPDVRALFAGATTA